MKIRPSPSRPTCEQAEAAPTTGKTEIARLYKQALDVDDQIRRSDDCAADGSYEKYDALRTRIMQTAATCPQDVAVKLRLYAAIDIVNRPEALPEKGNNDHGWLRTAIVELEHLGGESSTLEKLAVISDLVFDMESAISGAEEAVNAMQILIEDGIPESSHKAVICLAGDIRYALNGLLQIYQPLFDATRPPAQRRAAAKRAEGNGAPSLASVAETPAEAGAAVTQAPPPGGPETGEQSIAALLEKCLFRHTMYGLLPTGITDKVFDERFADDLDIIRALERSKPSSLVEAADLLLYARHALRQEIGEKMDYLDDDSVSPVFQVVASVETLLREIVLGEPVPGRTAGEA